MTFFLLLNIGSIFHQIHYYRVILLSIIGNIREKLINDSFRYESKKKKRNVRKNMKIRHDCSGFEIWLVFLIFHD